MSIIKAIDIDLQSAIKKTKYLLERLYYQNSNIPMELELSEKRFYANTLFDKIEIVEQMIDTYEQLKNKNITLLDSNFCNIDTEGSKIKVESINETASELSQITEFSLDEMKKIKIGALVRYIIKKMANDKKLSKTNISNLQNKEWCKEILLVNHQMIKKCNKYLTESDQRKINGVLKYYAQIYIIDESEYFVCSELYERSRQPFLQLFNEEYNIIIKNESFNDKITKEKIENMSLVRYNFDEIKNINNTSDKPCKVVIFNREYIVNNWAEVIVSVCECMISLNSYSMSKIVNESQFKLKNGQIFSLDPTILAQPKKLSNGIYVQTTFTSERILRYCYNIICYCEVESEMLEIYCYEDKRNKTIKRGMHEEYNVNDFEKLTLESIDSELVNEFIKILDVFDN